MVRDEPGEKSFPYNVQLIIRLNEKKKKFCDKNIIIKIYEIRSSRRVLKMNTKRVVRHERTKEFNFVPDMYIFSALITSVRSYDRIKL